MDEQQGMQEAFDEYQQLVALFGEWYAGGGVEQSVLEAEFGRPIDLAAHRNNVTAATRAAFDDALVEAIAKAFAAGIRRWQVVEFRGWLSHNDIRELMARARRPYGLYLERQWPQYRTLEAVQVDVLRLMETDRPAADRLVRASRTLLKRWVREIPAKPTEKYLSQFAAEFHDDHIREWKEARRRLVEEIDKLGRTGSGS